MAKNFAITDPCYLLDDRSYEELIESKLLDSKEADFTVKGFSGISKNTGKPIKLIKVVTTQFGDGYYEYKGQDVCVDSGLLCIAESDEHTFSDDFMGASFETLAEAEDAWNEIYNNF